MRTSSLAFIVFVLAVVALVAVSGWLELSVWRECRSVHSWLYCARTLG